MTHSWVRVGNQDKEIKEVGVYGIIPLFVGERIHFRCR